MRISSLLVDKAKSTPRLTILAVGKGRTYRAVLDRGTFATVIPQRVLDEIMPTFTFKRPKGVGVAAWQPTVLVAVKVRAHEHGVRWVLAHVSDRPRAEIVIGNDYLGVIRFPLVRCEPVSPEEKAMLAEATRKMLKKLKTSPHLRSFLGP